MVERPFTRISQLSASPAIRVVATILALPVFTAVSCPLASTVTTSLFVLAHRTSFSKVASTGYTVAVSLYLSPLSSVLGLSLISIRSIGIITLTSHLAL
ncbi:hypothetical protein Barb6_02369 [Bacteroidales bacterium Barb6]|nr:hypothetical protein Barb6_02369 [Bacteroidales bacterium Barb6]